MGAEEIMEEKMEIYTIVPIEQVFESPLNPRRTFDAKKMKELVESVKAKGVIVPLLVRPVGEKFEIAAGHRRIRAAIQAGKKQIPIIARDMTDTEFLEILIIENDKHEFLEPLEQALGYKTLMEESKYDIPSIAMKISKSESYVYQRLKLLELIPEAQKQLLEGTITAGHAILIARLQPDQQKDVLKEGLYEYPGDENMVSVRGLADFIETNIHLDLNSASFKKNDPDLVPEAGPCTTCTKRTGFVPALFPEIKKKDTCTDPSCFHKKVEAFTKKWLEEKSQDTDVPPLQLSNDYDGRLKKADPGRPIPSNLYHEIMDKKKDGCPHAREGIVIEGHSTGKIKTVCIEQDCKKHRPKYTPSPEVDKWSKQRKAEEAKRKLNFKIREAILDATLTAWPGTFTLQDLLLLAIGVYEPIWNENQKRLLKRKGLSPKKEKYTHDTKAPMVAWLKSQKKEKEIQKFLLECILIQNIEPRFGVTKHPDLLLETAVRYGVNPKKIEKEVRERVTKKPVQTSAKLKTRKKK